MVIVEKRRFYLAYGSNMNIRQMGWRCPQAKPVGAVILEGYGLLFRGSEGSAVATVEPKAGGIVPCALWLISPRDEAALDVYEGFPQLYRKEMLPVQLGRRKMRAMAYVMNDGREIAVPGSYYLHSIVEGYGDFGLETDKLYAALEASTVSRGRSLPDKHKNI